MNRYPSARFPTFPTPQVAALLAPYSGDRAEGSCTEASLRGFLVASRTPPASATPFFDVRRRFRGPKVTFGDSHTEVRAAKIMKTSEELSPGTLHDLSENKSCTRCRIEEGGPAPPYYDYHHH